MKKKIGDSIFQLSLTEIAFLLIFIILILLGWMYSEENKQRLKLEENLSTLAKMARSENKINEVVSTVIQELQKSGISSDEVISRLIEASTAIAEIEKLKIKWENKEETLTALEAVSSSLGEESALTQRDILDAIELASLVKDNAQSLIPYDETGTNNIVELVKEKLKENKTKENSDLRGQVAFLRARLEANGGRDFPPCWANEESGKIEYLFHIELLNQGLRVTPAWPSDREEDAVKIPNVQQITGKIVSVRAFRNLTDPILAESKKHNCRHYVYMKNRVTSLTTFNQLRYAVEGVFYKLEVR